MVKHNPLTIKMVFCLEFPDTLNDQPVTILEDSTLIVYNWNKMTKEYIADFSKTKLNKFKIISYYLVHNELCFINAYYELLINLIYGKDKLKKEITFNYLNEVKNYYQQQRTKK
jgi:hypothetical protein